MATGQVWLGQPSVKGPESLRMALLAFSHIGSQICWSVEMGYCTPYLLQLGLTKSRLSLVWIAGPLSGLIMQPIAGVLADRSTSRWGRRRPFMLGGSLLVAFFMYLLAWSREIAQTFFTNRTWVEHASIIIAVFSIYGIDFAINAVMASSRSLLVDTLPTSQQQEGSAWASRMIAIGTLVGHGLGSVDLTHYFGTILGETQFKQLISLAILIILVSVGVPCFCVTERVLVSNAEDDRLSIRRIFVQLFKSATNPPPRIRDICRVQFWAWIGWFPFMFYSTTWVGEIHLRYEAPDVVAGADATTTIGRVGSRAMVVFALLTGLYAIILPWFILSPTELERTSISTATSTNPKRFFCKPSLLSAWTWSLLQFSAAMAFAPFVTSVRVATLIIALCAVPFSLAVWAPFVFLGQEIKRLSSDGRESNTMPFSDKRIDSATSLKKPQQQQQEPGVPPHVVINLGTPDVSTPGPAVASPLEPLRTSEGSSELSGRYLGILNVYSTIPQFLGSAISMLVFGVLERHGNEKRSDGVVGDTARQQRPGSGTQSGGGVNGIAVCFFIGGLSSLMAAKASRRLRRGV